MSACFEQFSALAELSSNCRQLLFTSHWYGFLPVLENGTVTIINREDSEHKFDLINLCSYREEIKQLVSHTKGCVPYDIRIKSINDLIQSIISSATGEKPFNWILCEGMSEKIYLSHYYKKLINDNRLRIVPVGGAKEIKRIYEQLVACHSDVENELTGTIYLLSDTDNELVRYSTRRLKNLHCKRIVYFPCKVKTCLVNIDSNPISPATEIENALNGLAYHHTLLTFISDYPEIEFINKSSTGDKFVESSHYFDLKDSEKGFLADFFDKDNNKFRFAKKYIEILESENYSTPEWIDEIENIFINNV